MRTYKKKLIEKLIRRLNGDMEVKIGPCHVTFGGVDIGHTIGGVTIEYKVENKRIERFNRQLSKASRSMKSLSISGRVTARSIDNLAALLPAQQK